jgi:hypothetical protein
VHWVKSHGLKFAFAIGVLSIGIPFWLTPYNKISVPDSLYGSGLVIVFILALLLRSAGVTTFFRTLNVMAATAPSAVMARVIVEGLMDPTKHNLWPLVILIAAIVGYLVAAPAVAIGQLLIWLRQTRSGAEDRD